MNNIPTRRVHLQLDKILAVDRIIFRETIEDGVNNDVHALMDSGVGLFGAEHQEVDLYHFVRGIRNILRKEPKWKNLDQDTKTDIVRIAAFHRVLDEEKKKYPDLPNAELLRKAKTLGKRRGLHRKYFQP